MNKKNYLTLLFFFLACCPFMELKAAYIQPQDTITKDAIKQYKEDAKGLVDFFESVLNTLGSRETTAKEKDIIVSESYSKMFMNDKVQIEDDLDENRNMPINKDVQAYLKDVDFFFTGVKFEFSIQDITYAVNEKNEMYFKVTMNRHLVGKTIKGDSVNTNRTRYMEININENTRDLKIVSIYTNKINEKEEWRTWWNNLPLEWRLVLGANVKLTDSLKIAYAGELGADFVKGADKNIRVSSEIIEGALAQIIYREELDLSNKKNITDFSPLNKLTRLKKLILAGTSIDNLNPIRSMNNLSSLDISDTKVTDISALRYSLKLTNLNLLNTGVSDIEVLTYLSNIEKLICSNTNVSSLSPLSGLENLSELRCNNTKITALDGLQGLQKLAFLYCNNTQIASLDPLSESSGLEKLEVANSNIDRLDAIKGLSKLKSLRIDKSKVTSLQSIKALPAIEQVYCDDCPIDKSDISSFIQAKPKALVVYESAMLVTWWNKLPEEWKQVFYRVKPDLAQKVDKEELHKLTGITEMKITANDKISTLDPLRVFPSLKSLTISYLTNITSLQALTMLKDLSELDISHDPKIEDLSPLSELNQLEVLNCTYTGVLRLDALRNATKLTKLIIDRTGIVSLNPLANAKNLQQIIANDTPLKGDSVENFALVNPKPLVIWRAQDLLNWWKGLTPAWRKLLAKQCTEAINIDAPSSEQLHKLCSIESVIVDQTVKMTSKDLTFLRKFYKLKELDVNDQNITDLTLISQFKFLESLRISKNPIKEVEVLKNCRYLKNVDIENTPVENLNGFENLKLLTSLKISGTKVSTLEKIKSNKKLEVIECLNTDIASLKDITNLESLKVVKISNSFKLRTFGGLKQFQTTRKDVDLIIY